MRLLAAIALWAALAPSAWAQEVHFSPEEPLDAIDDNLMGEAKYSIDFASYALTDARVLNALNAAAQRKAVLRLARSKSIVDLANTAGTNPVQIVIALLAETVQNRTVQPPRSET
jgi:hypothetical protein